METNEKTLNLKINALLERLSNTILYYENQDADRRVELTILADRVRELEAKYEGDNVSEETEQGS